MTPEEQEALDYFYDEILCNEEDIKDNCEISMNTTTN